MLMPGLIGTSTERTFPFSLLTRAGMGTTLLALLVAPAAVASVGRPSAEAVRAAGDIIVAPGQTKQIVVHPRACQLSPACDYTLTVQVSKPRIASARDLVRHGVAHSARRKVYEQRASAKVCSRFYGCFAWHEKFKELFFYNGRKAWHHLYGYNYSYVSCDDNGGHGYDVKVTFCSWRGPNPAPYGNGIHMSGQVHYKVYAAVKGFPLSTSGAMSLHNYGDGYVGLHYNDSD